MIPLLKKEALQLLPFLIATGICFLLQLIDFLLDTPMLDGYALLPLYELDVWLVLGGLLTFSAAHNTIGRELLDGHIHFLDGLPLGRPKIFIAKLLVALSVPALLWLFAVVIKSTALWVLRDATLLPWTPTMVISMKLYAAGLLGFFGAGLLFSYFGELGYGMLALGLIGLSIFGEISSSIRPYAISGFDTVIFERKSPVYESSGIYFWLIFSAVSTVLAGLAFLRPTAAILRTRARVRPRLAKALLVTVGGLLLLLATLTVGLQLTKLTDALLLDTKVIASDRFRFLYMSKDEALVLQLAQVADSVDDLVREKLLAHDNSRLDIELIDTGRYHAGEFTGGKIRMLPGKDAIAVLAHELSHAHTAKRSGGMTSEYGAHFRFFNEGLAMWIESQIMGDGPSYDVHRKWAAAVWAQEQHSFELLVYDSSRGVRFDTFQVYPLGFVFVEALVEVHGEDAPAKLLTAIASIKTTKPMGLALWYGMSSRAKLPLDPVISAYEARLERYHARWPAPKLELTAKPNFAKGVLQVSASPAPKNALFCRFRPRAKVGHSDLTQVKVRKGRCRIPRPIQSGLSFWYQLGYQLKEGPVMYDEWVHQPVLNKK